MGNHFLIPRDVLVFKSRPHPVAVFLLDLEKSPSQLSPALPQPFQAHTPPTTLTSCSLFFPPHSLFCPSSPCIDPPDTVTVSQLQATTGRQRRRRRRRRRRRGEGGGSCARTAESLGQLAGGVLSPPFSPSSSFRQKDTQLHQAPHPKTKL